MNWKIYIFTDNWPWGGQGLKWHVQLSKQFGTEAGMIYCFLLSLSFFPHYHSLIVFPTLCRAFTNSVWLFSKMPRCHVRERSVHTEDWLCEPWTHKVYSVSCHYDTDSEGGRGGSPALFHPQRTWLMATWAPHSDLNPHGSLLPAVGVWGPSSGLP